MRGNPGRRHASSLSRIALTPVLFLLACSSGIHGQWRTASITDPDELGPVAAEIEFRDDGTFRERRHSRYDILEECEGEYEVGDATLRLSPDWAKSPFHYALRTEGDRMTLTRTKWKGWRHVLERSDEPHPALRDLPRTPRTVDEAVAVLRQVLSKEDLTRIRDMKESEIIGMHHGLGMWIRNAFGLWRGNDELLRACCAADFDEEAGAGTFDRVINAAGPAVFPDDASSVILEALWVDLQKKK